MVKTQLDKAAKQHQKVWLAFHIPLQAPVHIFLTIFGGMSLLWQDEYVTAFKKNRTI